MIYFMTNRVFFFRKELWDKEEKLLGWEELNKYLKRKYPNILHLVDLILTIFPSSCEAERAFSLAKLYKTDRRNSMKPETLNSHMGIRMLTKEVGQYDPSSKLYLQFYQSSITNQNNFFLIDNYDFQLNFFISLGAVALWSTSSKRARRPYQSRPEGKRADREERASVVQEEQDELADLLEQAMGNLLGKYQEVYLEPENEETENQEAENQVAENQEAENETEENYSDYDSGLDDDFDEIDEEALWD